jgi:hypothetical protein
MQWKWEGGYRFYGVLGCPPLSISTRKIVHNGLFIFKIGFSVFTGFI